MFQLLRLSVSLSDHTSVRGNSCFTCLSPYQTTRQFVETVASPACLPIRPHVSSWKQLLHLPVSLSDHTSVRGNSCFTCLSPYQTTRHFVETVASPACLPIRPHVTSWKQLLHLPVSLSDHTSLRGNGKSGIARLDRFIRCLLRGPIFDVRSGWIFDKTTFSLTRSWIDGENTSSYPRVRSRVFTLGGATWLDLAHGSSYDGFPFIVIRVNEVILYYVMCMPSLLSHPGLQ